MEQELLVRIEDAALNAWPSPRQMVYDGWLLRFTGGPSKRVNSVNVRYPSKLPLAEKITFCERVYASMGLPAIFRVPEIFAEAELSNALTNAGYIRFDPTLVLGREIQSLGSLPAGTDVRILSAVEWLRIRGRMSNAKAESLSSHAEILDVISPDKVLMALFEGDRPLACGMGVFEGFLLGYFSIYCEPALRRRGFGSLMMAALTDWGLSRGADFGYLQVEGDNDPAQAMYEKLGFELCYRYDYFKQ